MTETWLQWCIRQDGPSEKRGYGGVATRSLSEIEGEVKHSTEGPLAAALGELFKLTREASWHFTVPKDGLPRQHYSLESICWHCGGPGDRRTDTSLIGNLTLIGIEHEDYPDNQLNENQIKNTIRLSQEIRARCPRVAANPPTLRRNLWEHRELSATACPSGLIPWGVIIPQLQQEEVDMPLTADDLGQIQTLIVATLRSAEFNYSGVKLRAGNGPSLQDIMAEVQATKVAVGKIQAGGGPTVEQIADELAERLKE